MAAPARKGELLSQAAQDVIGEVGPDTRGVEKMLRRIGFEYVSRVDPFDGGPHFMAATDDVEAIKQSQMRRVATAEERLDETGLVAVVREDEPWFQAWICPCGKATADGVMTIAPALANDLRLTTGDRVWSLPF